MGLPASDAFTGTDGTHIATYSANWTLAVGQLEIYSNSLAPDASGLCLAFWNADAFGNDQYAQGTVAAASGSAFVGCAVRCNATSGGNGYFTIHYSGGYSELIKVVNGSLSSMDTGNGAVAVGAILRLEAEGTTIRPLVNGSAPSGLAAQTDSSLTSGAAGVNGYDDATTTRIDSWEGGNLGAVAYQPRYGFVYHGDPGVC